MSQSTDESSPDLPPPLPAGKWVQSSEEYRSARQKLKEQWSAAETELTEDLERVDRVLALLRAKRYALQLSPDEADFRGDSAPDLEEPPGLDETGDSKPAKRIDESTDGWLRRTHRGGRGLPAEHWTPETERLYDDVLYLFESGDLMGRLSHSSVSFSWRGGILKCGSL